jgi:hypothetical protein
MAINGVFSQFTSSSADRAAQADLRIDIQRKRCAARGPDGGCEWDGISNFIVSISWALEIGGRGSLSSCYLFVMVSAIPRAFIISEGHPPPEK